MTEKASNVVHLINPRHTIPGEGEGILGEKHEYDREQIELTALIKCAKEQAILCLNDDEAALRQLELYLLDISTQLSKSLEKSHYYTELDTRFADVLCNIFDSIDGFDCSQWIQKYLLKRITEEEMDVKDKIALAILRAMAQFGLWKTVDLSVLASDAVEIGKGRFVKTPVAALAIDYQGNVIATAHKAMSSKGDHAEEILLRILEEQNLIGEVCMVVTNLEPCDCRSQHHVNNGHQKGCSRLITDHRIPAVAYALEDTKEHQRGRGSTHLLESGVCVFRAADLELIQTVAMHKVFRPLAIGTILNLIS